MRNGEAHKGTPGLWLRGAVISYVFLLITLPTLALLQVGLSEGLGAVWQGVSSPQARDAIYLTLVASGIMAVINAVMGTATAWVLVRYDFPGRSVLSALIDLPFAIPTLVAGVALVLLFGPQSVLGGWLTEWGIPVIFAPPGIVLALMFISVPFVVRAVEPVLMEWDPSEEEAASTLGAGPWTTFWRVRLPGLMPVILSGTVRAFARALGEFGSIVVVSGNIPYKTLTAPVFLYSEIESGEVQVAAAVSVVVVALALALTFLGRWLEKWTGGHP